MFFVAQMRKPKKKYINRELPGDSGSDLFWVFKHKVFVVAQVFCYGILYLGLHSIVKINQSCR